MKCIQCSTDNNLKERFKSGKCKQCGHKFVFDPKTGSLFTDLFFKNSLALLSSDNHHFFNTKQLGYFLENRISTKKGTNLYGLLTSWILISIVMGFFMGILLGWLLYRVRTILSFYQAFDDYALVALILFIYLSLNCSLVAFFSLRITTSPKHLPKERKSHARFVQVLGIIEILASIYLLASAPGIIIFLLFLIGLAIGIFLIYLPLKKLRNQLTFPTTFPLQSRQLESWLERWYNVNGKIEKLLPYPTEQTTPAVFSPEITSYSFDRAIICETDTMAQFLIANNIHFDRHCAILSITGYPQSIFDTVLDMLKRNRDLNIYALHNASPDGVKLVHTLRHSPEWFLDTNVAIYDIGLQPRHVFDSRNLYICNSSNSQQQAQQLSPEVRQTLTSEELLWLEQGYFVELESFTPRKLLHIITQPLILSHLQNPNSSGIEWQNDRNPNSTMTEREFIIYSSSSFG